MRSLTSFMDVSITIGMVRSICTRTQRFSIRSHRREDARISHLLVQGTMGKIHLSDLPTELEAVHLGHEDVRDHNVEF